MPASRPRANHAEPITPRCVIGPGRRASAHPAVTRRQKSRFGYRVEHARRVVLVGVVRGAASACGYPPRMDERLAGYLAVVGLAGRGGHGARLLVGQFYDVVLVGEVAYRFPATRNRGASCPP